MKVRIKNYKGNLLESLRNFQKKYRGQKIVEARKVGKSLYITSEASKFDGMPNAMDELLALKKKLEEDTANIAENNEKIQKIEGMIQRFTAQALDAKKSAKIAKAQAVDIEKHTSEWLEEDCKAMAELMGTHEQYFFAVEENGHKLGYVITEAVKVASQKDAYADLFKKLSDEKFIKKNPELQGDAKNLIGLLEAARRTMLRLGLIKDEPDTVKKTLRANMYDQDEEGAMSEVVEGVVDSLFGMWNKALAAAKGFWNKVTTFFSELFFPKYEEAEAQYINSLQEYNEYLEGMRGACEEFIAENQ